MEYLVDQAADVWRTHTEHEFIARIADGSLPVEMFKYYLTQDYLFLVSPRKLLWMPRANMFDRYSLLVLML